jgi:hypothetical protein
VKEAKMPDTKCTNGMTCKRYSTGGFVLHRVKIPGSLRTFSAWYDAQGVLLDATAFTKDGWSTNITAGFVVWNDLVRLGKVWKERETP